MQTYTKEQCYRMTAERYVAEEGRQVYNVKTNKTTKHYTGRLYNIPIFLYILYYQFRSPFFLPKYKSHTHN